MKPREKNKTFLIISNVFMLLVLSKNVKLIYQELVNLEHIFTFNLIKLTK